MLNDYFTCQSITTAGQFGLECYLKLKAYIFQ